MSTTKELVSAGYDVMHSRYAEWAGRDTSRRQRYLMRAARMGLLKPGDVLDLGCGDGVFGQVLFAEPVDVGVDASAHELESSHGSVLADIFEVSAAIAEERDLTGGYRIVTNIGSTSAYTVTTGAPECRAAFAMASAAACTTSCPIFWADEEYVGPAAIVNAHRFIFDTRDRGGRERLEILSQKDGAFKCRTAFNCTYACPRGIKVTKAINEVKQAALFKSF